jgi:streptogramin lyase
MSNGKSLVTELDLPGSVREPHEVIVDRNGLVWYDTISLVD